jgi:large subunit ribosomal protein L19
MNELIKLKENRISKDLEKFIETKYKNEKCLLDEQNQKIQVGDIISVSYSIVENEKERIQTYEGLVISISNRGLGKSFTLRRNAQGIGIEQIFIAHSPKILNITKKQSSKVRRAKLFFIRYLSGKSTKLKRKF